MFAKIEVCPIVSNSMKIVGYRSIIIDSNKKIISGGMSKSRETAIKIAIMEGLERGYILKAKNDLSPNYFLSEEFPTSSGYAFDKHRYQAKERSICEAVERWVRQQWIDKKKKIDKIFIHQSNLTDLAKTISSQFDKVYFYFKEIDLTIEGLSLSVNVAIAVCIKNNGIFTGQKASFRKNILIWDHALNEAWNNYYIFNKINESNIQNEPIINKRIFYFGQDSSKGLSIIKQSTDISWDHPKVKLIKCWNCNTKQFFLWRTIVDGYTSEDNGNHERFIY